MRVELALIVGILFFCCWCAYIIVKMNSSVASAPDTTTSNYLRTNTTSQQQQPYLVDSAINNKLTRPNGGLQVALDASNKPAFSYSRQAEATAPTASYFPTIKAPYQSAQWHHNPAPSVNHHRLISTSWPRDYSSVTAPPQHLNRWRPYAPPSGHAHQPSLYRYPETRPWQPSVYRPSSAPIEQPLASEEPEPDPDGQQQQSDPEGEEEPAASGDIRENEEEEDLPEVKREIEERTGRRSFEEDQSDANERDRDGNLVVAHRKRTVNGKPVRSKGGVADLKRIAGEIDEDSQSTTNSDYDDQTTNQDEQQPQQESRASAQKVALPKKQLKAFKRQLGKVKKQLGEQLANRTSQEVDEPAEPKELHEHRMRESLSAQHWDDDANSPQSSNNSSDKQQPEEKEEPEEEEEELEEGVASPQQVESNLSGEFDMMADPEKFMESGSESRRRKKRESPLSANDVFNSISAQAKLSLKANNEPGKEAFEWKWPSSLIGAKSPQVAVASDSTSNHLTHLINKTAFREESKPTSGRGEIVQSLEDINVEMVSDPPGSKNESNPEQRPSEQIPAEAYTNFYEPQATDPNPNPNPNVDVGPPFAGQNGHSGGQMVQYQSQDELPPPLEPYYAPVVAPANQASGPIDPRLYDSSSAFALSYPIASGSKAKKKVKKFKKSKLKESKYKAAKAEALKKKSKSKKGGRNRKKKKAKKKFAKSYKEFEGTKQGKKKAKGAGQQGGNKGALFYKDKGYKKRGFKKAYQKLETGDHKTYFDEFRDKDHNKKWKNFKDKHHYSQSKNWKGKDKKKYKNFNLKELNDKKYGSWRDKAASKYHKASKYGAGASYSKHKKFKKKKKKSMEKKNDFAA